MTNVTPARALPGIALACFLGALMLHPARAQPQHPHQHHQAHGSSPHSRYAGMQSRAIKALSDQQVADLRAGKGMSLALPGELNGYPGPLHVLELAEPLKLSAAQRSRTEALFAQMQQEARVAGESVIAAEAALDTLFRDTGVTEASLAAAVASAAQAQGALRETHLRYHVRMMEVLRADQVASYQQLRGY